MLKGIIFDVLEIETTLLFHILEVDGDSIDERVAFLVDGFDSSLVFRTKRA